MFTLVEPSITGDLLDRPHLGCAMLIAACRQRGIDTTLIRGQTRYLRDMFVNDSDEFCALMLDLKDDAVNNISAAKYKKYIREKGIKQFRGELKD